MIIVNAHGRMGNQYFEYAFAKALKLDLEKKYGIKHDIIVKFGPEGDMLKNTNADYSTLNKKVSSFKFFIIKINRYFAHLFFKNDDKKYKYSKFIAPLLSFFGIYYNTIGYIPYKIRKRKVYILDGYFQSAKYFCKYSSIIKKELRNKNSGDVFYKNVVCVHVRRGDYNNEVNKKLLVCSLDYYKNAIEYYHKMNKNYSFYVFSDDIKWCKDNLSFSYKIKYEDENKASYENFAEMYYCDNFILSNSSYSWWAQYLALNKKYVVAPNTWNKETNNKDIYMDDWIQLKIK